MSETIVYPLDRASYRRFIEDEGVIVDGKLEVGKAVAMLAEADNAGESSEFLAAVKEINVSWVSTISLAYLSGLPNKN